MPVALRSDVPPDDSARISALRECAVLDTPPEPAFDDLARMAAQVCQTPIALVSLVDTDRQWMKSRVGLDVCQTSRDVAFCSHAIAQSDAFIVPDAHLDDRFRDNPLVTGAPFIRFYAGIPLVTSDGFRLGALCVIDTQPRRLTEHQLNSLRVLAAQASGQLELRRTVARLAAAGRTLQDCNAELERLRSEAEAASRAKSAFLINMSHEIRTPMTAVLGYIELLRDEAGNPLSAAERAEALAAVQRNGEHLLALVNDILDLSKIESGEIQLHPSLLDTARVLRHVISLHQRDADHKGLKLVVGSVEDLPKVVADENRVAQILRSLIGNAIKFTPQGRVGVSAGTRTLPDGRIELRVRVEDTGVGVTPEQARRLFEPFVQADDSTTRRFGGTGLGLAIAHRIACIMGGDISVEPREGGGSVFTFSFVGAAVPADNRALADPVPGVPRSPLACSLLLAEDCPDTQRLFKHHLSAAGAQVDVASDGRTALDKTLARAGAGNPYSLVLMDMQMPEMDGCSATQALRAAGYTAPIVALTAHALIGDRERCLEAGCNEYFTKPIGRENLIDLCHRWSDRVAGGDPADPAPARVADLRLAA